MDKLANFIIVVAQVVIADPAIVQVVELVIILILFVASSLRLSATCRQGSISCSWVFVTLLGSVCCFLDLRLLSIVDCAHLVPAILLDGR